MRRMLSSAAIVLALVGLGACGGDDSSGDDASSDTSGATTTAAAADSGTSGSAITIKDFAFAPSPLQAAAGATIEITNNDSAAHTVTADDKGFDTGSIDSNGNKTFTAPSAPGTYAYHCSIHDYMKGSIQVGG